MQSQSLTCLVPVWSHWRQGLGSKELNGKMGVSKDCGVHSRCTKHQQAETQGSLPRPFTKLLAMNGPTLSDQAQDPPLEANLGPSSSSLLLLIWSLTPSPLGAPSRSYDLLHNWSLILLWETSLSKEGANPQKKLKAYILPNGTDGHATILPLSLGKAESSCS